MTAKLRHVIRSRPAGTCEVVIRPANSRSPIETFKVSAGELKRFAWAVLNDLEPEEAALSRMEEDFR